jgi:hypothetical protein
MKAKITVIALFIAASGCMREKSERYEPNCVYGECHNVNIKGSVYVKPSGKGLKNILVDVLFIEDKRVWFPETKRVISGRTNTNGEFDLKTTINTKTFENYFLEVSIPEPENYIVIPTGRGGYIVHNFHYYNEEALKNINVVCYNKATLTINLKRTHKDDFDYLSVSYSFDNNYTTILSPEYAKNGIMQTVTAADVYTIISWQKTLKNGTRQNFSDSLICKQDSNKVFTINY